MHVPAPPSRALARSMTAATLLSLGCATPPSPPNAERTLDARPFAVGAALEALDAGGQFVTEDPPALPYPSITAAQAREQAVAAARTFGPELRGYLERKRGAPIDFSTLVAGRTHYAWSVYEQTLPADFHPGFRRAAGPYYLVTLLDRGAPAMTVAVSVYNTDVEVTNGRVARLGERRSGAEFHMEGVKQGDARMAPERAAQIAADFAGVRVASAPRYELPRKSKGIPQLGTWRMRLERPVRVRDERGAQGHDVDELVIGRDGVPTRAVPGTVPPDRYLETITNQWVEFRPRAAAADSFVRVTRVGRN